jgi:hypothetical protein
MASIEMLEQRNSEDMAGKNEIEHLPPDQFKSTPKTAQLDVLCREAVVDDFRLFIQALGHNHITVEPTHISLVGVEAQNWEE